MPLPFEFDFKKPDYNKVFSWRMERISAIRKNPECIPPLRAFYKNNINQFIIDWGMTYDPRNVSRGLPAWIPFLLFEKQEKWVDFAIENWKNERHCLTEKSREMGVSWLTVAVACSIAIFYDNVNVGFGSRKREYVDAQGDPKSFFYRCREFTRNLPPEFRGEWDDKKNSKFMQLNLPISKSKITGESGTNIGRGDRTTAEFLDEFAFFQQPYLVDAAVSQTSNAVHYISTPNGPANSFAEKRFGGKIPVFSFHWRDDPRKNEEWYQRQKDNIANDTIIAQELDLDYNASIEGILIKIDWVEAAINAHAALNIEPDKILTSGADVADQGADKNAFAVKQDFLLNYAIDFSGKGSDIEKTTRKFFNYADEHGVKEVRYDADGLGVGVRGDARKINEGRQKENLPLVNFIPVRGSAAVVNANQVVNAEFNERKSAKGDEIVLINKSFFENYKAQSYWYLAQLFRNTYKAVKENRRFNRNSIISISADLPNLQKIKNELTQIRYERGNSGKILIKKTPPGSRSPNLADAINIAFGPQERKSAGFFTQ